MQCPTPPPLSHRFPANGLDGVGIGVLRRWFNHGGELVSIRNKRTHEMIGKKRPQISSQNLTANDNFVGDFALAA